jgi:hypothetical protein
MLDAGLLGIQSPSTGMKVNVDAGTSVELELGDQVR